MGSAAHGVVTRAQLLRAGVTAAQIEQRLRTGALLREHRGVYRVGHRAPSLEARYLAAVWACGEGSLLSGRAAAHLLGLLQGRPPAAEVTAPTERRVKGIRTRRTRGIRREDATIWRGVPVTSVARTLVDLAASVPVDVLARACHEAGVRHHVTPANVEAVLALRPNSPGATGLREILRGEARVALSKLEARFLERLRAARTRAAADQPPRGRTACRLPLA
jgi:hypothetical protein